MQVNQSLIVTLLTTLTALTATEPAIQRVQSIREVEETRPAGTATGLITNRLSEKQLKEWKEIERLVFSEDSEGRSLHPILKRLWQWAESSPHAIYIELQYRSTYLGTNAGRFRIEHFDSTGKRHVAVIKLRPSVIDSAVSNETVARSSGFIPFYGLQRKERYAEVLGHELAHAYEILKDLKTARLAYEVIEQTNSLLTAHYRQNKGKPISQRLMQRLDKRDSLLEEFESFADAVEEIVWDELIKSREVREDSSRP